MRLFVLILIVAFADPSVVHGQSLDGSNDSRFLRWAYQDPIAWLTSWNTTRLVHTGAFTAAMVPSSGLDEPIDVAIRRWDGGPMLTVVNYVGSRAAVLAAGGVFGLTLVSSDTKLQNAAFTSVQAAIYADMTTFSLKFMLGRARPEDNLGPYDFEPFSSFSASFPSGHATTAFALLSTWAFYYPSPWTYALFGVAAGTGLARLQLQKHWLTDVLAGAANGTATSYWLVRRHQGRETRMALVPIFAPGIFAVRGVILL